MEQEDYTTRHFDSHYQQQLDVMLPTPHDRLPTLSEIKIKIPSHCFRATVCRSISYVILDIFFIIVTYTLMLRLEHTLKHGFLFLPLYWYVQGKSYECIIIFRRFVIFLYKRHFVHVALLTRTRLYSR